MGTENDLPRPAETGKPLDGVKRAQSDPAQPVESAPHPCCGGVNSHAPDCLAGHLDDAYMAILRAGRAARSDAKLRNRLDTLSLAIGYLREEVTPPSDK